MLRSTLPILAMLTACEAAGSGGGAAVPADAAPAPQAGGAAGGESAAAECPLTIAFGSYAMGIDRATFAAVEALLAADAAVTAVERSGRGREGEVELCAHVAGEAEAERLFHSIAERLPADPRGPITVATRTGLLARAPARR